MKLRLSINRWASLWLVFTFLTAATAAPRQVLHGHVPAAVAHLKSVGDLAGTNQLNLAIGLPLRNREALTNLLQEIYDPASPQYHHYLTPEQFTERFSPTKKDYQAVMAFAKANGLKVTQTHPNRMLLDVKGSVANIQSALHVRLREYRHLREGRKFYAPETEPSLDLAVSVLSVGGLDNYTLPRPRLQATRLVNASQALPNAGSGPSGTYMGKDFRAAYVPDSTLTGAGQVVGLLQFDGYTASDITYYENQAGLPSVTLSNVLIDGASGGPSGGGGEVEVSLDIEMAISMATNLSKVMIYMAPNPSPWEDLLNRMVNDNAAKQISCSWYQPNGPAKPTCDQIFQQMAAQGQSFFSASGDDDAYTGLIPFPGDTPYITEVGGTTLTTTGPGGSRVSEKVWNWGNGIGSGGGISTQYPIPSWQTNISMAANQGSTTMRNVPDVALTADNVYVRADGQNYNVGGTSCAAPLWAGFAALVNQQAAAAGKPTIGFINPAVDVIGTGINYPSAFHDITTGNNTSGSSPTKFYAVAGYDLCTGWGTPAGQNLINALANPEALLITPGSGFSSIGGVGGPFTITSLSLTLTNAGTNALSWTLANTSAWLNASPSGGTLTPGGSATAVTVSLNAAASNLVVGTYSATVWFTNLNSGVGQGRQFNLSVISPPTITTQPTNQAVLEGATVTFTVEATGGLPLSYQWQDNGTNLTDGGNITGSTTTNLTINNVSSTEVGTYSVIVTNFAGVAVSSNALLTITPSAPVIIMQPASQTAVVGETAVFTVTAIGTTPFIYQWSFNGTNLGDATNAALTLANIQLNQAGTYAVAVSNVLGSAISSNATLTVYTIPVIASFCPQSGTAGTAVNISGFNFDPTPSNNIIYFGAVQAAVSAASVTNLVVTVPVSATYGPITETVNGLTAYANQPFLPTFSGDGSGITVNSFAPQLVLPAGSGPNKVVIADLDGDGKPDLIVANDYGNTISLYRNISTNGSLTAGSFAPPVNLVTPPGSYSPMGLAVADVDGDGKLDIIVSDYDESIVSVYRNTCTPGNISSNSFATRVDFATGAQPQGVEVRDLDGDGKPDLLVANSGDGSVSILRNTGVPGSLTTNSFAPRVDMATGSSCQSVAVGDLDGDGKPDVVAVNSGSGTVSLLRNISTPGSLTTNSFAAKVDIAVLSSPVQVAIGDLDGDGKPDLTVTFYLPQTVVSVFRNISTVGSLTTNSFAPGIVFPLGGRGHTPAIADLDGDGKPDLAVVTELNSLLSIFRNVSTPGSFTNSSFAPRVDLATGWNAWGVAIGDLDGDGRPDIVFCNSYDNTISVYQNIVPFGTPPVITSQPTNQTVAVGGTVNFSVAVSGTLPLSYQWSCNTTNLVGATNSTLTLTNVQFSQAGNYAVLVTNTYGSSLSSNALLTVNPAVPPGIISQPTNQTVFAGNTASFSVTASGSLPLSYQWNFNGTNLAGATGATLTLTNVALWQSGNYSVLVTNYGGSILSPNATLTVLTLPPTITQQPINQSAFVGGNATFSVTASGTLPLSYQWSFNTTNLVGATNATLTLTNVQFSQAGSYAVQVTNIAGTALSSNAVLTVNPLPPVPVITGFAPATATVGASVRISGTNFSPVASNNIVYFGAVQAAVSAASVTNLVVTVPVSATYGPITETVNGLTAYAHAPFLPTFFGDGSGISVNSFAPSFNLASGNGPNNVVIADLDGDGKPDLVVSDDYNNTISIYRNISTNGSLTAASFAPRVDLVTPPGSYSPFGLVVADVDGDGKLDIIVSDYDESIVSVYRNTCTPGNLSTNTFATRVDFATGAQPQGIAVADLDGDGRPDLVVANSGDGSVSILRNTGVPGSLTTNSFAPRVDIATSSGCQSVAVGDLDGDGKPDVVAVNSGSGTVSLLRNISTPGSLSTNSFAAKVDITVLSSPVQVAIGDLDGDGKPDLTVTFYLPQTVVSVYRNTSNVGSLTTNSFAPGIVFPLGGRGHTPAIADLDGDGKPDLAVVTELDSLLSIFRNVSTPGSITNSSFAARVDLATGWNAWGVAMGDLDGDGRPDIVFANSYDSTITIYQNIVPFGTPPVITSEPTNQTVAVGGTVNFNVAASGTLPLSYQWSCNTTNLAGATNTTLTLTNVQFSQAGSYAVLVTNAYGSVTSSNAVLTVNDKLDHFAWGQIRSPRFVNVPFAVVIQALGVTNGIFTNFTSAAFLGSTNGVPISPAVSGNFVQGVWTGVITVAQTATNLVLQARDGNGESGLANPINIVNLPSLTTIPSGGTLYVFWPVTPSGFGLETTAGLSPANWAPVTTPPFQIGDQYLLPIQMSGTNAFFRLRFSGP